MMGDVMSDFSSKRGRIYGTESKGLGKITVKAVVPLAEMLRYAIDLRSISNGRGAFSIEVAHFEEAPAHVAQVIVSEYQKRRDEHNH